MELTRKEFERLLTENLPPGSQVSIKTLHILVQEDDVRIDISGASVLLPRPRRRS